MPSTTLSQLSRPAARMRAVARALPTAALAVLAGCYSWGPPRDATGATLRTSLPPELRVVVAGWPAPVVLQTPRVVGDSLVGVHNSGTGRTRVAVPLASVTSVQTDRFSPGRTFGLTLGMFVVLVPLFVLLALSGME